MIALIALFINIVLAVNSPNLFLRIEDPKSPTGVTNFAVDFAVVDTQSRALTVSCFRKNPDSTIIQLGSDTNIIAGGNSGVCSQDSNVLGSSGIYQYYAVAKVGSEEFVSESVSVEFVSGGPQTPSYSKEEVTSCVYKIKFKTVDDGKTEKVEIFRSSDTSFSANTGNKIAEVVVGPDTESSFNDGKPDCNKTYYYAIRAVDAAGNVSGLAGDRVGISSVTLKTKEVTRLVDGGAVYTGGENGGNSFNVDELQEEVGDVGVSAVVTSTPVASDSGILGQGVAAISKSSRLKVLGLIALGLVLIYVGKKRESKKPRY